MKCRSDRGEEGAPVCAAKHAREDAQSIRADCVKKTPAFADAEESAAVCIGYPDGALRIKAYTLRVQPPLQQEGRQSGLSSASCRRPPRSVVLYTAGARRVVGRHDGGGCQSSRSSRLASDFF